MHTPENLSDIIGGIKQNLKNLNQISQIEKTFVTRPTSFRVNTLKSNEQDVINSLSKQRIKAHKWKLPNSYYIDYKLTKALQKTKEFKQGLIYMQSFASMLPVIILDPKPGEVILDVTAAPGSKTSQIASITKNKGSLDAVEIDFKRHQRLLKNLKLLDVDLDNYCKTYQQNALNFLDNNPQKTYDKILLDAPCSSSAKIILNDNSSFQHITPNFINKLSRLQFKLINAAFKQLKPGGYLVYSTCSLDPKENHLLIRDFLHAQQSAKLQSVVNPAVERLEYQLEVPNHVLEKTLQVMPDKFIESFYIALIQKKC